MHHKYLILFTLIFIPLLAGAKTINPLEYGLLNAKTGEERFWVLFETHEIACKKHWNVSYKGIEYIELEIPNDAKSIPLGNKTDFCGLSLVVTNTKKDNFFLYELSQKPTKVSISKELLASYDFNCVDILREGLKLLVIVDNHLWIDNREGHDYGAKRRDVLLLKNGRAKNKTIAPYLSVNSDPSCEFVNVTSKKKVIKNVNLQRTIESSKKTFLVRVSHENNVLLQGIKINTPEPISMTGDYAIQVENSSNVSIKDVKIEHTYSSEKNFGYGIALQNVWNVYFENIQSESAWGVFGNQNLNTVHGSNSIINRFDAHCYARDFYFSKCVFSISGVPQSSFYGNLSFDNCTFNYASVCGSRVDYNAYTPFKVSLNDCIIYINKQHHTLVDLSKVPSGINNREELHKKYAPGLFIKNTTVIMSDDITFFTLYQLGSDVMDSPFDYLGPIKVDGLSILGDCSQFMVFNRMIDNQKKTNVSISGVYLNHSKVALELNKQSDSFISPQIILDLSKK